ncbi:hypothetical protein EAH79_16220 [Sphingomonas koreensis]|nr:hypothetical protein EAH79_16220 [Sphingomonas koreensis]
MESIAIASDPGNRPLVFTWFDRHDTPAGRRGELQWPDLCDWIEHNGPTAAAKSDLPLLKLATFNGDYRTNETLAAIYGVEGDYDGEAVQPADAADMLRSAGIAALIYTSPSHRPDAPRWRVLAPLSHAAGAAERHALVARLNGALGGILATESFTASQAFYVGAAAGGEPVRCWRVEGRCIDTVDGIEPRGPAATDSGARIEASAGDRAPSYDVAVAALRRRDPDMERNEWLLLSGSFFTATDDLASDEQRLSDWQAWNVAHGETNDPTANARTWAGFARSGTNGDFATLARLSNDAVAMAWHHFKGEPIPPWPVQYIRAANDTASLFVRIADMVARPPVFLVDGLIEEDALAVLFGDPASGKSLVAIDMAASIATGHPFHGRSVRSGATFYIAGEGKNGLRRRFAAWETLNGQSLDLAPLYASQTAVQFLDGESAALVMAAIDALAAEHGPPRLIVIDTLARNFGGGDENSTADMNRFVVALDKLRERFPGSTVLLVHHSGHGDKERARGSSVLRGAVDTEYKVAKVNDAVHLTNHKMKDAAPPPPMAFDLVEMAGSVALEYAGEPSAKGRKPSAIQALAAQAFDASAEPDRVTLEAWRTAFYALHTGSETAKRKAFTRGRDWMTGTGMIRSDDDGANFDRVPMPGMVPER